MQLYDRGDVESQTKARSQLIEIVEAAGDDGFETLVRALAMSDEDDHKRLARQLDEQLAQQFTKQLSECASRLSLSFSFLSSSLPLSGHLYLLPPVFVLFICLLARLFKNTCMDLDEMLHVDICRDMDELINF